MPLLRCWFAPAFAAAVLLVRSWFSCVLQCCLFAGSMFANRIESLWALFNRTNSGFLVRQRWGQFLACSRIQRMNAPKGSRVRQGPIRRPANKIRRINGNAQGVCLPNSQSRVRLRFLSKLRLRMNGRLNIAHVGQIPLSRRRKKHCTVPHTSESSKVYKACQMHVWRVRWPFGRVLAIYKMLQAGTNSCGGPTSCISMHRCSQ